MDEYLDIKNKAIEDSKNMNFEGMSAEQKEEEALRRVKEMENIDIKLQMIYAANFLIPDDEEFLKNFSEDKSVRSLAQKYGYSDFIISTKIRELKDRIDAMEAQEPKIEGDSNMEELNMEMPELQQMNNEMVTMETPDNGLSMESYDLKPNEEVAGQKSSNLQETVDALANLGSVFKANNNQEETIANLNDTIEELKNEKEELIQSNKDKDASINSLEEDIEEFKRAKSDLEDELAKRDETIKDLNEENANKDKTIKNLEEDNNRKDSKIEELRNINEEQDKEINSLNARLSEKDAIIAERDETIENNVIQFDTLNKKFLILRDENEAKDRKIREQEENIAELENVKADYTQLVSTIKEFAASKTEQSGPRLAA